MNQSIQTAMKCLLVVSLLLVGGAAYADTTPPTIWLVSPHDGDVVSGTVEVKVQASDLDGVDRVEFYIDGTWKSTDDKSPYSYGWDTESVADGSHTIMALAFDNAGNSSSDVATVTVSNGSTGDIIPPKVTFFLPLDGAVVDGTVIIEVAANDNEGMDRVDIYIDGALKKSDSIMPYGYEWNTTGLADGSVPVMVVAYDISGNSTTETHVVVVNNGGSGDTIPPTVSITSPSNGATVSEEITIVAIADDATGIDRVEFYIDGSPVRTDDWSPYEYDWDTEDESDGSHTITVEAFDDAGNSNSASISVTVNNGGAGDTTPPAVSISSPSNGATVSATTTISASASDAGGIDYMKLYIDGVEKRTYNSASFSYSWNTTAYSNAGHTIEVRAWDNAGNQGTKSISVTVDNGSTGDTTPPTVSIKSPSDGATVDGTETIKADASDASGIERVEFYIDGSWKATDNGKPYSYPWDTEAESNGGHTIMVKAFDNAGNSASTTINVTVDNGSTGDTTPPTVSIKSPSDGATVDGTETIKADANDASGIDRVEFYIDGTWESTDNSKPFSHSWDTENESDGNHTILARAFDNAGNSNSASISVTVDNGSTGDTTPPTVSISTPSNNATVSATTTISASASDAGGVASMKVYIDGVEKATYNAASFSYAWNTTTYANTDYTIEVRAWDNAGNMGSRSISVTVNNVSPDPVVSITSPASGSVFNVGASIQITANADDPDGWVTKVDFYRNSTFIGTATSSPYACTWSDASVGSYDLTARAYDNDGRSRTSDAVNVAVLDPGDTDVGFTPGNFAVNDLGAATYSIPIALPPGTAGMTPEVSLNFNSQGANGLLGQCWELGGPSYIARCGRTIAQDGVQQGVNMDTGDRLMLDGKRLINHTGNYWADWTQYRTEIESYSKVVDEGEYFTVHTKSGEVMYFGLTADERLDNSGVGGTMMWALSKIEDRFGNYIRYEYGKVGGRLFPERIEYTMNDGQGMTEPYAYVDFVYQDRPDTVTGYLRGHLTSLTRRLEEIHVFNENSPVRKYLLQYYSDPSIGRSMLSAVFEEDGSGNALPPTTFTYEYETEGFNDTSAYLPPSPFVTKYIGLQSQDMGLRLVDFDGDGLTDILQGCLMDMWGNEGMARDARRWTDTLYCWYTQSWGFWDTLEAYYPHVPFSGYYFAYASPDDYPFDTGGRLIDLNGDGLLDMIQSHYDYGDITRSAWINNGTGWTDVSGQYATSVLPPICGRDANHPKGWDYGVRFVDLNGDGLMDMIQGYTYWSVIFYPPDTFSKAWLNNGNGWTDVSSEYSPPTVFCDRFWDWRDGWDNGARLVDLNGDGLKDIVRAYYNTDTGDTTCEAWLNTPSSSYKWVQANHYAPRAAITGHGDECLTGCDLGVRFADLNGDGLEDMVKGHYDHGFTTLTAWLNTGNGWSDEVADYAPPAAITGRDDETELGWDCGVRFVELNADGLVDMVKGHDDYGDTTLSAWLNTGKKWIPTDAYTPSAIISARDESLKTGWDCGVRYADMNGDGLVDCLRGLMDNYGAPLLGYLNCWLNTGSKPHLVKVETGVGKDIDIDYKPLTDTSVYTKGSGADFPTTDVQAPLYVVSEFSVSDGIGGTNTLSYKYSGLRAHAQGRGLLGFESIVVRDNARGSAVQKHFLQDFPFIGLLFSQAEYQDKNGTPQLLKYLETEYSQVASGGIYRVRSDRIDTWEKEYNDLAYTKISSIEYSEYDAYDNAGLITTHIKNGDGSQHFQTVTDNDYTNDATNWILARLTSTTVTHSLPDETTPDTERHSSFTYYPTGALESETVEPGSQDYELTTTYTYDPFGNKETATVTGSGIVSRTSTTGYDNRGRFAIRSENALGHVVETEYDTRFGLAKEITVDPDGVNLVTEHQYDGFARLSRTDYPDGTYSVASYSWVSSPTNAVYKKLSMSPNLSAPVTKYYDCLDRVIRTETVDRFGQTVLADVIFDTYGRVTYRSKPYFSGESADWTEIDYDEVDRPDYVVLPDGAYTNIVYDGLKTTRTDNGLISTTQEVDARGNLIEVINDLGDTTRYEYDAVGNLTAVVDAHNNRLEHTYDNMGHKETTDDPDMGEWSYYYNALGQVWKQVDARNQETIFEFDLLGRMKKRISDEGTTEWTYDNNFIGKLGTVTSPDGYIKELYYDDYGRSTNVVERIDNVWYEVQTGYDTYGRPEYVTYPDCGNGDVKTKNVYNGNGYVNEIRDAVADTMCWQALDADAGGRLTQTKLGNNIITNRQFDQMGRVTDIESGSIQDLEYDWDAYGNLEYRIDGGAREDFDYDDLHRLESWTKGVSSVSYDYDAIGNITYKSNVGYYTYDPNGRPHAVEYADGNLYEYDANGNMTHNRTGGELKTITYTSFNKPSSITRDGNYFTFEYGADLQRTIKSGPLATSTYIGGVYEKVVKSDMETHRYYFAGGSCILEKVAAIQGTNTNWQPDLKKYVHKDHLGSTHVVTGSNGSVIEKYEYTPFGEQLAIEDGDCTRGFTGHEHDDEYGLINMKARMYDPVLGRFISPDPFIQRVSNGQSLNRYSYVHNNPLRYTDPSGYGLFGGIGDIISGGADLVGDIVSGGVDFVVDALGGLADAVESAWQNPYVRMAVSIYIGCYMPVWLPSGWAPAAKFAIAGAASAAISSGGDPKTILLGAATGAAFYGVGNYNFTGTAAQITAKRVVAHAFVGGIRSELQGGKFIHGALSAGVTKMTAGTIRGYFDDNIVGGAIASGIVCGTVSTMSGGKFENGFYTGAMAYTFNEMSKDQQLKEAAKKYIKYGDKFIKTYLPNETNVLGPIKQATDGYDFVSDVVEGNWDDAMASAIDYYVGKCPAGAALNGIVGYYNDFVAGTVHIGGVSVFPESYTVGEAVVNFPSALDQLGDLLRKPYYIHGGVY